MILSNVVKGDALDITCTISNYVGGLDSTAVRAEIYDETNSIRKANTSAGGSEAQVSTTSSQIIIHLHTNETSVFTGTSANIEVDVTTPDGKRYTVLSGTKGKINFIEKHINWT